MTVDGIHLLRADRRARATRGAVQVARPLTEVDNVLDGPGGADRRRRRRDRAGRAARSAGRAHRARADRPLHPPNRGDRGGPGRHRADGGGRAATSSRGSRSSFNTTLDALERAVEAQRQLVADASHELRTPIASLRANIQTLEDADRLPRRRAGRPARRHRGGARRADRAGGRHRRAGARQAPAPRRSTTSGSTSSSETLVERAAAPDDSSVRLRDRARADAGPRRARPHRARRGEPARQRAQVEPARAAGRGRRSSGGALTVRDHGPGFAEADLPHVFDRFYRAEAARGMPGSGLGLAIVRQIAEVHGARRRRRTRPTAGPDARALRLLGSSSVLLSVVFGRPL